MGIKISDKCTFCHDEFDSVEHMLLRCHIIRNFWDRINNWIEEKGFIGYKLTERKIILGYLENGQITTTLILLSKKVIYDSFKRDKIPSLAHVQNETKKIFYLEKYSFYLKHKSHIFKKTMEITQYLLQKPKQRIIYSSCIIYCMTVT